MITHEIRVTGDGSKTIFLPELNETYHSTHGALREARHVFIEHGLELLKDRREVHVLEVGFGSGLNALLTGCWSEDNRVSVNYTALEAFPLSTAICFELDYPSQIGEHSIFLNQTIIQSAWRKENQVSAHFSLTKIDTRIQVFETDQCFDLIYFDAFGPRAQAEMWEYAILEKAHNFLKTGGTLVSYCAKGQFKRDLKAVGFRVESLPGPPGKREMTRAKRLV